MRNKLEHIDNEILKDEIKKGQPIFLMINEDASEVKIGDKKLNLISLAEVVSKLHKLALELALYNSPGCENEKFKYISPKTEI